ncbi:MAG: urea transporter [Deltaproteobacteria bacterium]|nr:urea transporter [Deltaproteobacteria bacterium]
MVVKGTHGVRLPGRVPGVGRAVLEILLRPYAQVVFSRDLAAGALVLAAVACMPKLAGITLAAVAMAAVVTWLLGLGRAAVREGIYGCMALLTTLALLAFAPNGGSLAALVLVGTVTSVLLGASFQTFFARLSLPAYVLPFVSAAWLVHLASRSLSPRGGAFSPVVEWSLLPAALTRHSWLDVPASLLFVHGVAPGVLVLLALLVHSRIGFFLAGVGAVTASALRAWLRPDLAWSALDTMASFNAMLTAMVVGGVWFVPQPSSMALAAGAAGFSVLVTYALMPMLAMLSLPVLSLPFVITVLAVLTAARMRQQDRWPRSAAPADRPEDALARHLSRVRRFGELAWLPFRLPFRGEWYVSQGWDGEHTHKGPWRHGLDFEGRTAEGKAHRGEGRDLRDYVCYGLPVLAAGAGTVALVVDGIEDNRPGEVNTRQNWGNAAVIAHGPWLHTVYAHLQPKSIRVKPGDVVTPGTEIGRCGNSGRSAVPHLHFQVQRGLALGSPTIPFEFGDVVECQGEVPTLGTHMLPRQGTFVRPVHRDDSVAQAAALTPGTKIELRERNGTRVELAKVEMDLLGTRWLSSPHGRVAFETYDNGLVLLDCHAGPDSLLRFLVLAWARLPFDQSAQLRWQDSLSRRWLLPRWSRLLADVLTVVAPVWGGLDVSYSLRRREGAVEVEGHAADWSCRTVLSLSGPHASHMLFVEHHGKTHEIEIGQADAMASEEAA